MNCAWSWAAWPLLSSVSFNAVTTASVWVTSSSRVLSSATRAMSSSTAATAIATRTPKLTASASEIGSRHRIGPARDPSAGGRAAVVMRRPCRAPPSAADRLLDLVLHLLARDFLQLLHVLVQAVLGH